MPDVTCSGCKAGWSLYQWSIFWTCCLQFDHQGSGYTGEYCSPFHFPHMPPCWIGEQTWIGTNSGSIGQLRISSCIHLGAESCILCLQSISSISQKPYCPGDHRWLLPLTKKREQDQTLCPEVVQVWNFCIWNNITIKASCRLTRGTCWWITSADT